MLLYGDDALKIILIFFPKNMLNIRLNVSVVAAFFSLSLVVCEMLSTFHFP